VNRQYVWFTRQAHDCQSAYHTCNAVVSHNSYEQVEYKRDARVLADVVFFRLYHFWHGLTLMCVRHNSWMGRTWTCVNAFSQSGHWNCLFDSCFIYTICLFSSVRIAACAWFSLRARFRRSFCMSTFKSSQWFIAFVDSEIFSSVFACRFSSWISLSCYLVGGKNFSVTVLLTFL
jgi:hypothetical protein